MSTSIGTVIWAIMPQNTPGRNAMMRSCAVAVFALGLTMPLAAAPLPPASAVRTQLHAIQTLTLSDKQFLTGDSEAKATTVSGQLRLPAATGRPAVGGLIHRSRGRGPA